jgi:prepilin-type N-terminal cleavage/methylation domain-containing protein
MRHEGQTLLSRAASAPSRSAEAGFTLIELLIVVAIIAILAAIAVPNLLDARIRSQVARAKSDLRTLTVAVETYYVDHTNYPLAADEQARPIVPYPPVGLGPEVFETRLAPAITTPVGYLAARPRDPFAAQWPDPEDPRVVEGPQYHYGYGAYAAANNEGDGVAKFGEFIRMYGGPTATTRYFVGSHGPDLDHDDDEVLTDIHAAVPYDPTNGAVSGGDIVRFGPSAGFGK